MAFICNTDKREGRKNLYGGCNAGHSVSVGNNLSGGCNSGFSLSCGGNIEGDVGAGNKINVRGNIKAVQVNCEKGTVICNTLECDCVEGKVVLRKEWKKEILQEDE